MINTRALALAAVAAAILCGFVQAQNALLVAPPATQASGAPAEVDQPGNSTASAPHATMQRLPRTTTPRVLPQGKPISIDDLLTGITLSDEQKPRIEQVRKTMRERMDRVAQDKNENIDQKQAMFQGLHHMELREVYLLLTPDQRIEVRKRIEAKRAAEQQPPAVQQDARPN